MADKAADTNGTSEGGAQPEQPKAHRTDAVAQRAAHQAGKLHDKKRQVTQKTDESKGPKGGFDPTPLPRAPPGWTVRITFHRANNLPVADLGTLSSDPYVVAEVKHRLPTRHKQDPPLRLRTPTIRRDTNPVWDCDWVLCNVPASGFELKCRVYDEDAADHDDRLGNAHVTVAGVGDGWAGIREQALGIKKRMGSKRAYLMRGCATLFDRSIRMSGELVVSVHVLGRTQDDNGGRVYTLGPCAWSQHFSPMIGRLVGTKAPEKTKDEKQKSENQRYNFEANQVQLRGPVPEELYHRYVEFRPFVSGMFNAKSLRGRLLNRALHHQHSRIYNYDRSTVYGSFPEPSVDMTKQFLDLVHYDDGARIFTYVLTLDGLWRFTETGAEFSIDLLSKHTMHSNVSIYIAFSGEFFVRRLRSGGSGGSGTSAGDPASPTSPEDDDTVSPEKSKHHHRVGQYQLVIDNDSGTYRPNQDTLPQLKEFMQRNLPGLNVMTLSCVDDEQKMEKMKGEQRERKKTEGHTMAMAQVDDDSSSVSSSDEEGLDRAAGGEPQMHRREKLWHRVSEPKAAVLGWAQKGHGGSQRGSRPVSQVAEGEQLHQNGAGAGSASNGAAKHETHEERREERHEEKHEEKQEQLLEGAAEKTGFAEPNKEEGTAEKIDMEGPSSGTLNGAANGTMQQHA